MGLDMYLQGHKFYWQSRLDEDGFRIREVELELGYWRKHPNLHGYIVETFAGGKDECQDIELDADALRNIMAAIKERRLPHTTGFFFGVSSEDDDERAYDLGIFEVALAWLEAADKNKPPELGEPVPIPGAPELGLVARTVKLPETMPVDSRRVVYRASW